ncbi:MAG TPA: ABC transporter [Chloroflexi bacterium]|nr:ABC transporter [Chloroflexota bacterium]
MNIFLREVRANIRSLLIWASIVALLAVIAFTKFSAYANNPEMLAILDQMPAALIDAFNLKAFNLTTLSGFYGALFTYYALILSIAAAMWGSDIIAKEERDKTIEFALTLPVTRSQLVTGKLLAALANCIGLLLITWGITFLAARPYHPDRVFHDFLNLSMLALFILQMVFLSIGIFLGCAMKRYKQAGSTAISLLLAAYFFSIISEMHERLDFLKYLSPFRYFDAGLMLRESRLDLTYVGLSAAIIVVSLVGAYMTYARRDLYI